MWNALVGVYETEFGDEPAAEFMKAVRAWHAGIKVVGASSPLPALGPVAAALPATPCDGASVTPSGQDDTGVRTHDQPRRRVIARLPVPRPLQQAVEAGHFGTGEDGKPVNPSADEVHDITTNHAEMLVDLLDEQRQARDRRRQEDAEHVDAEIQTAVAKYAEDFGERAGEQLLAYCRRQVQLNQHAQVAGQSR